MAKPILLSVDDDSDVLRAIERDLRSQYGAEYRVIGSDSPEGALDLLKQLKVRNDSVALLLADHAAHGRGGILAAGNGNLSRREAGIAHRVRGHERRDQRHQSCQHQLLFLETMGSACGASVSAIR